ncbi:MAG: phosphotransferase, partial [Bacteroidota bacterium]
MSKLPLESQLAALYQRWCGTPPELVLPLAPSGSARIYYRLEGKGGAAIGAYNPQQEENRAFLAFSKHFKAKGLPVPEIYLEDSEQNIYLQEDLGFTTLYSFLLQRGADFPDHLIRLYKLVVERLAELQIKGGEGLDYSDCFPRQDFDKQSMLWDFNTFKYYFLRLAGIPYDEQALEDDLHRLADYLLTADSQHFMFRDFQTRNIMIKGGQPYFIDYQGGRRGALQYDLASLLFQAKADIPQDIREQLLEHYLDKVETLIPVDRARFTQHYYGFVLIRTLQVLGAYGYRGLYERKQHFLQSIPFALGNLRWLLEEVVLPLELPTLKKVQSQSIAPTISSF